MEAEQKVKTIPRYRLHIFALSSFVVAQPLLDVLSKNAELLVASRVSVVDLLILVFVLLVVVPLLVILPGHISRLFSAALGRNVFLITIGLLSGLFFLLLLKEITSSSKAFLLVPAGLLGTGFVLLYIRHDVLKLFCSYLSPAVLLIPILFVFNPAVSRVVFNSHIESTYATSNARDIPVVMVVFDELPLTSLLDESAHIDSIRYPNFASLETDGHWFRNAHTVSSLTTVAVPAILSGVKKTNALPIVADHPQNLFTLLGQTHEMNVTEIVTSLCPDSACKKSTNLPLETN